MGNLLYTPEAIGERVRTQSNWHITAEPQYLVCRTERVYGVCTDYTDLVTWVNRYEGYEADKSTINLLEARYRKDGTEETPNYRRVGYVEREERIQFFFTEAAAQVFMMRNKHNYGDMYLYVEGACRNAEWQAIRAHLAELQPVSA